MSHYKVTHLTGVTTHTTLIFKKAGCFLCSVGALFFFVTNVFVLDAEVLNEDVLGKAVFFILLLFLKGEMNRKPTENLFKQEN